MDSLRDLNASPRCWADRMPTLAGHLRRALGAAQCDPVPYRHWTLADVLPAGALPLLRALPFAATPEGDNGGQRAHNNAARAFVDPASRAAFPVCGALAEAFQSQAITDLIGRMCDIALSGTSLRIEYCQDRAGFWLEPHTDIGEKRFTMLVYLSAPPEAEAWGTDIFDGPAGGLVKRSAGACNTGLIFVPAADTWHGFAPRPITGIRRTLIVNYVGPQWRARHELAYPDRPIA